MACENGNILITNPGSKFYECNGSGTTYQQVTVSTVQADRLKKCDVRGPYVSVSASPITICVNDVISLSSSATSPMESSPAYTYSWSTGANTPSTSASSTVSGIYTYTVTITNTAVGCSDTASVTVTVDDCVDINETTENIGDAGLFPNPTSGLIYIDKEFTLNNQFEIFVFNTFGELIAQGKNTETMNLSVFGSGIYYVSITSDKEIINKKVILIK